MSIQTYKMMWQGIEIELTYETNEGNVVAHLEVRSVNPERAPLPITETGYKSHFRLVTALEENNGTLVDQVAAWLNEKAKSKAWQKYVEDSRQLSLF